jgi:hypothetical protein
VIGVRGVVREKLEKQETMEKGGGGGGAAAVDPPPPSAAKRRKLSKSDSVESSGSSSSITGRTEAEAAAGTGKRQVAAKRKLAKSDSLDSNLSSDSGHSSGSHWAAAEEQEEEAVADRMGAKRRQNKRSPSVERGPSAKRRQQQKGGGAAGRSAAAGLANSDEQQMQAMLLLPLRFQYDFEANNDSDYDVRTGGEEEEVNNKEQQQEELKKEPVAAIDSAQVSVDKLPENLLSDVEQVGSDDVGAAGPTVAAPEEATAAAGRSPQPMAEKQELSPTVGMLSSSRREELLPLSTDENECLSTVPLRNSVQDDGDMTGVSCNALGKEKSGDTASQVEKFDSDSALLSAHSGDEVTAVDKGDAEEEDLNCSRDSEDVWAAFRLKDEILLEDNTEIWANTMDIFKSMEDMFTNSNNSSQEDDVEEIMVSEKGKKEEEKERSQPAAAKVPVVKRTSISATPPEVLSPRDSVSDGSVSSGGDSSKENNYACVEPVTGGSKSCSKTSGSASAQKKSVGSAGRPANNRPIPLSTASAAPDRLKGVPAPTTAGLAGRQTGFRIDSPSRGLPAAGTAAVVNSAATASPSRAKQQLSSIKSPAVKLIEPSPLDPERLERLSNNKSSRQNNHKQRSDSKSVGRRLVVASGPRSSGGGGSSRLEPTVKHQQQSKNTNNSSHLKTPSSTKSLNKDKLLSFLDREYERELSKSQSRQPKK